MSNTDTRIRRAWADLAQLAETHAEEKKIVLDENELLRSIIVDRLARLYTQRI